jgi:hypothetical protein
MMGMVPLIASVTGAVVNVVPLYIIVTDGHVLLGGNGPPDIAKHKWSRVGNAGAVVKVLSEKALLKPNREAIAGKRCVRVMSR